MASVIRIAKPSSPLPPRDEHQDRHARFLAILHHLTFAEFEALVSPAQQRALLARYNGLSESSKPSALRRVKVTLELIAEHLTEQKQAGRFSASTDFEGLEGRLYDH